MLSQNVIRSCSEYFPRTSRGTMYDKFPAPAIESKMAVTQDDSFTGYIYDVGGNKYYCCAEISKADPTVKDEETIICMSKKSRQRNEIGGYEGVPTRKSKVVRSQLVCDSTYNIDSQNAGLGRIDASLTKTIFRIYTNGSCGYAIDCVIYTECGDADISHKMNMCNAVLHHIALENAVKHGICLKNYEGYIPRCYRSTPIREKCPDNPIKSFCIGTSVIAGGALLSILGGGAIGFIVGAVLMRSLSSRIFNMCRTTSPQGIEVPELKEVIATKSDEEMEPLKTESPEEIPHSTPSDTKEGRPLTVNKNTEVNKTTEVRKRIEEYTALRAQERAKNNSSRTEDHVPLRTMGAKSTSQVTLREFKPWRS